MKTKFMRSIIVLVAIIFTVTFTLTGCTQKSLAEVSNTVASPAIEETSVTSSSTDAQVAVAAAEITATSSSVETSSAVSSKEESSSKATSSTVSSTESSKATSSKTASSKPPVKPSKPVAASSESVSSAEDIPESSTSSAQSSDSISEVEPNIEMAYSTNWPANSLEVRFLMSDDFYVSGAVCNGAEYGGTVDSISFAYSGRTLTCTVSQPGIYYVTVEGTSKSGKVIYRDTMVGFG